MPEKPMTDEDLTGLVKNLVRDCEAYRDARSQDRIRAIEYYDGVMKDVPADEGRSRVVSRDVRSAVKKVKPSIVRTILGNDEVVEYLPMGQGDEEAADQASDYINYVVLPESAGRQAIEDAIDDALRLRNGVLKWHWDKRIKISVSMHTGLSDPEFQQLVQGDDVDVLEHTAREEMVDTPEGVIPIPVHDVKIKRREEQGCIRLEAVQPENFLIHSDAVDLDDSPIVGENVRLRRSDLVAMGYERKLVDSLPMAGSDIDQDSEEDARRQEVLSQDDTDAKAMQEVEYYDLLVRVDFDNDGIAELRRIVYAGAIDHRYLLENEECDDVYYGDIACERRPHQWEGTSIFDDVAEIQKIKTVLLRQTLDNLYWQNNLQDVVEEGAILNPEAVLNPQFGMPIRVKQGTDVRAVLSSRVVPFVAKESFAMLSYLDEEATDRTGISDASSGMAPDALQNMTAKASAMIEQAGIGQTEMMVRTIAHGLKRVFRGLLKLVKQHQDKPRTVRLRDKWVTFDPRSWNSDMDATVNTGLGAGTRERDMMMMTLVIGLQEKLLAALGPDNDFVTPDNLHNALSKQVESAGLKTPSLYFTKPDPEVVRAKLEAAKNAPSEEQQKAMAQMEIEKAKGEIQLALADKKMQADASKEQAQLEADIIMKDKDVQAQLTIEAAKIAWEREKFEMEQAAQERERQADREFQAEQAEKTRQSDMQRSQAEGWRKEMATQQ
jgi:hypothetical protein